MSTRRFALLGKAHPKWWYEADLVEFDPKGVFSFRPDGETRKNEFSTQLDDIPQPAFLHCLQKPSKNGGMKPTSWNLIPRVFFCSVSMGISTKRVFNPIGRPWSNRRFALLGKSHPKWWFETDLVEFDHKGVFSFRFLARQKKQPWDQILQFRFHATILGGLFQAAEKSVLTKVVQLRSKRVFSTFPMLARQKKQP